MRNNNSKPNKCRSESGSPKSKKLKKTNNALGKTPKKDVDEDKEIEVEALTDNQECIFLDSGSKKSYMELTKIKSEKDQYPRMSVIRTIVAPTNFEPYEEFYQEKPVDFSPKNKYKTECSSSTIMDISRNYTTAMVV